MKILILPAVLCTLAIVSCRDLFEKDISGKTVEIVAPRDGVTAPEGEVTFLWKPVESADRYHLTIVSPGFANAAMVMADTIMPDTILGSYAFRVNLGAGEYQWRIRAHNSAYMTLDNLLSLTVEAGETDEPEEPEHDE